MSDSIMSPDGNFMWTGSEWIPAPPIVDEISIQEEMGNNIAPWIGVLLYLSSIFFPYLGLHSPMDLLLGRPLPQSSPSPEIYSFSLLSITMVMMIFVYNLNDVQYRLHILHI